MDLSPGTRLGPYELLALLGAGGMGEVYRARDTRLGRTVAVKVLPAGAAADPDRRRRFEQEARAASALAHPNICVLFDIGSESGLDFLVMEYLDGPSLAERLRKGALPTSQVLEIGLQIASALDRAHRDGIVHRDLKPGNVMLTKSGAKLLDFGLAKLRPGGILSGEEESAIPTEDVPITDKGTILGTLPYMSPEQLEGKVLDGRSDLFSFGAMLYEMLTGQRAFAATSSATLITAIMSSDPAPVSTLAPLTPPGLDRVVRKCLAKDRDARWQSAADLADELRWLSSGSGATSGPVGMASGAQGGTSRAWKWAAGAAAVVAVAAAGWAWWATSRRPAPRAAAQAKHTQITFSGDVLETALTNDGRTVAYKVGTPGVSVKLLMRDLGSGHALQIWEGKRGWSWHWTPDDLHLVFVGPGDKEASVSIIPRLGGAGRVLFSSPDVSTLAISPDGKRVATTSVVSTEIEIVSFESGKRDRIALPELRFISMLNWSPVTDRLAIASVDLENRNVVTTVQPDGSDIRRVYSNPKDTVTGICWSRREDVLYLQVDRGDVTEIVRLPTSGKEASPEVLVGGLVAGGSFQVSADGQRLLHRRATGEANLYRLDLEPNGNRPVPITRGTWNLNAPAVSPDGRWVVADRGKEIVRFPTEGGEPVVIGTGSSARWSPDGKRLAFASDRGGSWRPWVADADGQQAREVPGGNELANEEVVWFSERKLAWHRPDLRDYRIRDLETGKEETLVKDPLAGFVFSPRLSPQGDRIAVFWNRGPGLGAGLWIISWPNREEQFVGPDLFPHGWSADGKWIYAGRKGKELVRVSSKTLEVETVLRLAEDQQGGGCDLTPDRKSAVCSIGFERWDAWLIENFDPHVPPPGR